MCSDNQPPDGRHTAWQGFTKPNDDPTERAAHRARPPRRNVGWFAALLERLAPVVRRRRLA